MDFSQTAKLQRGTTVCYSESTPLSAAHSNSLTLTTSADLLKMASVLLQGLPLLPHCRVCFKSVGYLPESHPAVTGNGWGIKAWGGVKKQVKR